MYMSDMKKSARLLYMSHPPRRRTHDGLREVERTSVVGRDPILENELVSGHEPVAHLDHATRGGTSLPDQVNHRRTRAEHQFRRFRLRGWARLQRLDELCELMPVVFESGVDATEDRNRPLPPQFP